MVLTFESVDEILWWDHSNETSLTVLSDGAQISIAELYQLKFGYFSKWSVSALRRKVHCHYCCPATKKNHRNKPIERLLSCVHKQIFISTRRFFLRNWRFLRLSWLSSRNSSTKQFLLASSRLRKPGFRSRLWLQIWFRLKSWFCYGFFWFSRFSWLCRLAFCSQ